MIRPRSYDDPANFDIHNRPSNASLRFGIVFGFFLSAFPGGIILPLLYVWIIPEPTGGWAIVCAAIGALIGMSMYFPHNLRDGRIKRREYVKAGGDPTGISDHMFGAMGGCENKDGQWQWSYPSYDI